MLQRRLSFLEVPDRVGGISSPANLCSTTERPAREVVATPTLRAIAEAIKADQSYRGKSPKVGIADLPWRPITMIVRYQETRMMRQKRPAPERQPSGQYRPRFLLKV